MSPAISVVVILAALAGGLIAGSLLRSRRVRRAAPERPGSRRILFPFTAHALAPGALDAALRLARNEDATLVPVFLARVALRLPLDAALPRQAAVALTLQEAIEQRAAGAGVPVDARIERGRTVRHALQRTLAHERYDRLVLAAAPSGSPGLHADEVAWLIDHAPGEIIVLRPAP